MVVDGDTGLLVPIDAADATGTPRDPEAFAADIAERVGVRKASLYNSYPSKDELLMELLRRSLTAANEYCLHGLDAPGAVLYARNGELGLARDTLDEAAG